MCFKLIEIRSRQIRFETLSFPKHAPAMCKAVRDLMAPCPDISFAETQTDEFIHRLLHASLNQFGILVEFVHDALEVCLLEGSSKLEEVHFADAYTARTGEIRDEMNVFLANRFDLIDVAASLYETPLDQYGKPTGPRALKRPNAAGRAK